MSGKFISNNLFKKISLTPVFFKRKFSRKQTSQFNNKKNLLNPLYSQTQFEKEHILTPFMMGTSTSLDAEDNVRVIYMMEEHLLKKLNQEKFKAIVSINACPLNTQINKSILGYKTVKEFSANRFVDKNGQRPFESAEDYIKACVQIYEKVGKNEQ